MCRVKSTHGALTKIKDATHKVYMKKEKKKFLLYILADVYGKLQLVKVDFV